MASPRADHANLVAFYDGVRGRSPLHYLACGRMQQDRSRATLDGFVAGLLVVSGRLRKGRSTVGAHV